MTTWFTSDLHLGHSLVANHRGFADVRSHDNAVLDALRSVPSTDELWILGDLTNGSPTAEQAALGKLRTLKKRNMHLIAGNHDSCSPIHRDARDHLPRFLNVFQTVQAYAKTVVDNQGVLLCHFPYADHPYEYTKPDKPIRYLQYHFHDMGQWLLHGHTHSDVRMVDRSIHVGLDAWAMKPVHIDEVAELMARTRRQSKRQ